jgi:uncharacterized protein (DUF58 family)
MSKIIKIIPTLMITFLLFFTVDARNSAFFSDIQLETSIENHRQCSADDVTGRISKTFPSRSARQLKNTIRYPNRFFQGSLSPVVFIVKKPTVSNTTPDITPIVLLTTVLRI